MMKLSIPKEALDIIQILQKSGFEAYLVGGCVRDLLLGNEILRLRSGRSGTENLQARMKSSSLRFEGPRDWDVATNAKPEEIQKLFPESVYENEFGTVGVKTESDDSKLKIVEVTTFRKEGKYTDKRHPDEIKFAKTIEEDLSRRDFTINALALKCDTNISIFRSSVATEDGRIHANDTNNTNNFIDPYDGQTDLENKIIRTVGDPHERFQEDALRLLRAARLATELGFEIEFNTRRAIEEHAGLLEAIAQERIRDELIKLIESNKAAAGIILLEELNLLRYVLPEFREGLGVSQNLHHIYTVFEHGVRALEYTAKKKYPLHVRFAALMHDIGKPKTKRGEGYHATFHGHEIAGAKLVVRALDRLRFSKEFIEKVAHLVRYHMFYYNVGEVSPAGVRRFLARVGPECVDDLLKLREADRIGSGTPKAVPYKNRHLLFMIEKVKRDPISPKMLAVRGDDVMRIADIPPSPKVGQILEILLEEVLEEPLRNARHYLESRIKDLGAYSNAELEALRKKAREKKDEFESSKEDELKKRYYV